MQKVYVYYLTNQIASVATELFDGKMENFSDNSNDDSDVEEAMGDMLKML